MSCILRIGGTELDVDALMARITLTPDSVYRRGEPLLVTRPEGKCHSESGARFLVSDADFDEFDIQKSEAIAFLRDHADVLRRIMAHPGVEDGYLDFGIARKENVFSQCDFLPAELLKAAGDLGLGIEISHYPVRDDEEGEEEETTPQGTAAGSG